VTAVAFVLPPVAFTSAPISVVDVAEDLQSLEILRFIKPLSPPPRFANAL